MVVGRWLCWNRRAAVVVIPTAAASTARCLGSGAPSSSVNSSFFSVSAVYIPLPLGSVHLVLLGSLGALLGYGVTVAVVVGLFLQTVMFGHGGLTTLGLNALIMGVPALLAAGIFHRLWPCCRGWRRSLLSFSLGSGSVLLAVSCEGMFTAALFNFLEQVKPEMLKMGSP